MSGSRNEVRMRKEQSCRQKNCTIVWNFKIYFVPLPRIVNKTKANNNEKGENIEE